MLPSPWGEGFGLRDFHFSGLPVRSLTLRPGDSQSSFRRLCRWASGHWFPSSLPSKLQGCWLLPWWDCLPLNAPAFAGRTAPQRILTAHASNQCSKLRVDSGTATVVARTPAPVSPETTAMPAQHCLRLHDEDGVQQCRKQSVEPDLHQAVEIPQAHAARMLSAQHDELLAKEEIFRFQPCPSREPCTECLQQPSQKRHHPRSTHIEVAQDFRPFGADTLGEQLEALRPVPHRPRPDTRAAGEGQPKLAMPAVALSWPTDQDRSRKPTRRRG